MDRFPASGPRSAVELLAPAGGWETLQAVVEAGADAVYFSEKRFAMRQHGAWLNFVPDDIPRVIDFLHERGRRAYLAINNLLTGHELTLLAAQLADWAAAGPDAVIVQDLGLLKQLHDRFPDLPLHASTMMNIHHSLAARFLRSWGVSRVITSRDITVAEAGQLGREAGVEVEYFIHGDMCVAMGGQCLHSGLAAGYSANRGKCLKSCRWSWTLVDRQQDRAVGQVEASHLLARKDLCLYHQIPELLTSGLHSLKIEGRARPADYLAPIVAAYRQAMDRYVLDPAGYVTDFAVMHFLRRHTLREVGTNHAFHRPGADSSGLSGRREPRFFSIGVETPPCPGPEPITLPVLPPPALAVRCATPEQVRAVAATGCTWIYLAAERFMSRQEPWPPSRQLLAMCHDQGKRVGVALPRTTMGQEVTAWTSLMKDLVAHPPDEYLVAHPAALALVREQAPGVAVHADYGFNIWNPAGLALLAEAGVSLVTPGLEITWPMLEALAREATLPLECMIHGPLPGMLMAYCPIGAHLTRTTREDPCPGPCHGRGFALVNPLGGRHWLEMDQHCRGHLFLEKDLCTLGHLQHCRQPAISRWTLEGSLYPPATLVRLVEAYLAVAEGRESAVTAMARLQPAAPRPWTLGPYASGMEPVSEPCQELPTNWIRQFSPAAS